MPPALPDGPRPAVEALLADLGSQVRRGPAAGLDEPLTRYPTGVAALDALLGGGFARGRLSEICGPPSSGRTALALALVARVLAGGDEAGTSGGLAGWVDLADALDPISVAACGIDLERLLWIRPERAAQALRGCDRLLQTEGFELVVFDCAGTDTTRRSGLGDVAWLRLARAAARTRTALVVLSEHAATGAHAEFVLEMQPQAPRFTGTPSLLETLETRAVLRRHRTRPDGRPVPLSLSCDEIPDASPSRPAEAGRSNGSGRRT